MADKTYKIQATLSNGSTIETGTFVVPQGPTGASAGFGTPTVSTTTGNPGTNASVTVTTNASTPNTAKVFNFSFTIPRGNTGATGLAALEYSQIQSFSVEPETEDTFTIQTSYCNRTPVVGDKFLCNIHGYATVAGRSWIAGCTVYRDGGTLKGQIKSLTETTGAEGLTALVANPISNSMVPSSDTRFTQSISPTRTPVVGDKLTVVYNCTSNGLVYMLMCNIESVSLVSTNVYSCQMLMRSFYVISGDVGPTGPTGPQVSTYRTTVSGKNISGVASNMVFYTTTSPASGWHIVIDDGEL